MASIIEPGQTILFQGDSITDCGRNRDIPEDLGFGYPLFVSQLCPRQKVVNRGISGNRVVDLEARWHTDTLDIKPDVLSILIGINDVWRRYDANDPTSTDQFHDGYRRLLRSSVAAGIEHIVLVEPFVLPTPPDRLLWREDLDPKIMAVRELAREFRTVLVPMDGLFAAATTKVDPAFWAEDGVHPSAAGHRLIAETWVNAVGLARQES